MQKTVRHIPETPCPNKHEWTTGINSSLFQRNNAATNTKQHGGPINFVFHHPLWWTKQNEGGSSKTLDEQYLFPIFFHKPRNTCSKGLLLFGFLGSSHTSSLFLIWKPIGQQILQQKNNPKTELTRPFLWVKLTNCRPFHFWHSTSCWWLLLENEIDQLMVGCWFGVVVWIPRIPLWKGLLLGGYPWNPKLPGRKPTII